MKTLILFFILNILTLTSTASDTLVVDRNHMFTGKILNVSDRNVYFETQQKIYKIPTKNIHTLIFADTLDPVFISYIKSKTDNNCALGRKDAHKFYSRFEFIAAGLLLGPLAIRLVEFSEPTLNNRTKENSKNSELFNNTDYLHCYITEAKRKNLLHAKIGCGLQSAIGCIVIGIGVGNLTDDLFSGIEDICF